MVEMYFTELFMINLLLLRRQLMSKQMRQKQSPFFVSAAAVARTLFENKVRPNTIETCFKFSKFTIVCKQVQNWWYNNYVKILSKLLLLEGIISSHSAFLISVGGNIISRRWHKTKKTISSPHLWGEQVYESNKLTHDTKY